VHRVYRRSPGRGAQLSFGCGISSFCYVSSSPEAFVRFEKEARGAASSAVILARTALFGHGGRILGMKLQIQVSGFGLTRRYLEPEGRAGYGYEGDDATSKPGFY